MRADSGTTGPAISSSKSMKFACSLRRKYSSARLRPPAIAMAPSAMKSLLCMRWLSRRKSVKKSSQRVAMCSRPLTKGLNRRTCAFGSAASASRSGSMPAV